MRLLILLTALLAGCGGSGGEGKPDVPVPFSYDNTYVHESYPQATSSWYELNQYFDGVPKYSGMMGTYTNKHVPVAVKCSLGEWMTYSDNSSGELEIKVMNLESGEVVDVRTLGHTIDPHQNAAINCDGDKLVLHISARSDKHPSYRYESTDGYNWSLTDTSDWSYPQVHFVNGEEVVLYTNYTRRDGVVYRSPKSSCNNEEIIKDNKAHYMVSYEHEEVLHVIFNDMVNGADSRTNLGYTFSKDGGCTWSEPEYWWRGDRVYLKDLNIVNGEPTALVTIASTHVPTEGERNVYVLTANEQYKLGTTNHNYTSGALTSDGKVVFPQGVAPYAGGMYNDIPHVNYIRRVFNTDHLVASEGISSEVESDSWIIHMKKPSQ